MRLPRLVIAGLLGILVLAGCSRTVAATNVAEQTDSVRNVEVSASFSEPPGLAVTYDEDLVPVGARGTVTSVEGGGSTTVTLEVAGLQPDRRYGAHAHTMACGAEGKAAGPHFQLNQDPVQPSVDPAFANPQNEVWLDLTTDADGTGVASATVPWQFPADRRAESVIIHAMPTATEPGKAGTAGDRAACISVNF
jgi:superoxide dismutase, Cu-Zn family